MYNLLCRLLNMIKGLIAAAGSWEAQCHATLPACLCSNARVRMAQM